MNDILRRVTNEYREFIIYNPESWEKYSLFEILKNIAGMKYSFTAKKRFDLGKFSIYTGILSYEITLNEKNFQQVLKYCHTDLFKEYYECRRTGTKYLKFIKHTNVFCTVAILDELERVFVDSTKHQKTDFACIVPPCNLDFKLSTFCSNSYVKKRLHEKNQIQNLSKWIKDIQTPDYINKCLGFVEPVKNFVFEEPKTLKEIMKFHILEGLEFTNLARYCLKKIEKIEKKCRLEGSEITKYSVFKDYPGAEISQYTIDLFPEDFAFVSLQEWNEFDVCQVANVFARRLKIAKNVDPEGRRKKEKAFIKAEKSWSKYKTSAKIFKKAQDERKFIDEF